MMTLVLWAMYPVFCMLYYVLCVYVLRRCTRHYALCLMEYGMWVRDHVLCIMYQCGLCVILLMLCCVLRAVFALCNVYYVLCINVLCVMYDACWTP